MRGSIIQRGARSWAIIVDERDAVSGKRRRRWHSHKGTRKSAEAECARLIAALNAGTHVDLTRETALYRACSEEPRPVTGRVGAF